MYDANLSAEIFSQLMNGKIINKTILNNSSQFVENPLFNEVMDNLKDYRSQYAMNGVELVEEAEYLFIRDRNSSSEELKTDVMMKACLLLLLLGKYLTENNYRLSKLTDSSGGITIADIEAINEMPDTQEILEKGKMKNDLASAIKSILVERHIMLEKPSSQSYILSDSGRTFFDEIVKSYEG
ncbi:MAG: hypothetical protein HON94_05130 [Methylococcales bacterium]|nr:hypothetical protein [Methylococcales bacterium]MBT7409129.1 hypothetical protein [Methylococcales bacterium]